MVVGEFSKFDSESIFSGFLFFVCECGVFNFSIVGS